MVNKVILLGNLGKDPEVRRLENGGIVANFPLATNENYRDRSGEWQKITDWHNIVMWGPMAERAEKYLHKGRTIFLEGKIRTRKWQDNNGNDRYTTEIIAQSFRIIDKKENTDSNFNKENNIGSDIVNKKEGDDETLKDTENQIDDLPF